MCTFCVAKAIVFVNHQICVKTATRPNLDFRGYLQDFLVSRTKRNPAYSLRSFARQLGVEPSYLSKILRGHRSITVRFIHQVSPSLGLNRDEISFFVDQLKARTEARKNPDLAQPAAFSELSMDTFKMIADWYHYAILELTETRNFVSCYKWISRRLKVTEEEVSQAIERLIRLGFLDRRADAQLVNVSGRNTTLGHPSTSLALKSLQKQILSQAIGALEELGLEVRDQSSLTIAIDPTLLPEVKKRIMKFRRELCSFLDEQSHEKSEVYQLSLSFFPATQISEISKGNSI